MSLLDRLFGAADKGSTAENQVYIVDAGGFIERRYRDATGQASPRDNFYVLKNLAFFAQREDLSLLAVFCGRPLREAAEGSAFKGVTVYYADSDKAAEKIIARLARAVRPRQRAVVITDDRATETEARKLGAQVMRLSTLKKGMDTNSEHHDQRSRQTQKRPPAEEPRPDQPDKPEAEEVPPPQKDDKGNKNVLDLIDPI